MADRLLYAQLVSANIYQDDSDIALTINRLLVSYSPASISEEMPHKAWARRSGGHPPRPGFEGAV